MANILDSYLVELGVSVKPQDIVLWDNALGTLGKKFDVAAKKHENWVLSLAGGSTNIMRTAARADMAMQKLAVRLYTTVEGARQFSRAMSAMGLKGLEDLKDVANNPELTAYYHDLMDLAWETDVLQNKTYQNMMKRIRGYEHEFDRLKVISKSLLDQLAIAIFKTSSPRLEKLMKNLKEFEGFLLGPSGNKALSRVGSFLGDTLNSVLRIGDALYDLGGQGVHAYTGIKKVWDALPERAREYLGLGGFSLLAKRSPMTAGFVALSSYAQYHEQKKYGQVDDSKVVNKLWGLVDKFWGKYYDNFDSAIDQLAGSNKEGWQSALKELDQRFKDGVLVWERQYVFPFIDGVLANFNKIFEDITPGLVKVFSEGAKTWAYGLKDAFTRIWSQIADNDWIKGFTDLILQFYDAIRAIQHNFRDIWDTWKAPFEFFSHLSDIFKERSEGKLSFLEFFGKVRDAFKGDFSGWGQSLGTIHDAIMGPNVPELPQTPANWVVGSNGNNTNNTATNNFTFNISGASDPTLVAATIRGEIGQLLMPMATVNRSGLV